MIVKIVRRFLSRGGRETFCHHLSGGGCGRQACRVMPHGINGMLVMVLPLLLWVDCLTVVSVFSRYQNQMLRWLGAWVIIDCNVSLCVMDRRGVDTGWPSSPCCMSPRLLRRRIPPAIPRPTGRQADAKRRGRNADCNQGKFHQELGRASTCQTAGTPSRASLSCPRRH